MKRLWQFLLRSTAFKRELIIFSTLLGLAQFLELAALAQLAQSLKTGIGGTQALQILALFLLKGFFLVGSSLAASWMLLRLRYLVQDFLLENLAGADFHQARIFASEKLAFVGRALPESLGNLISAAIQLLLNSAFLLSLIVLLYRTQPTLALYATMASLGFFAILWLVRWKLQTHARQALDTEAKFENSWYDTVTSWTERKLLGIPSRQRVEAQREVHFSSIIRRDFWRQLPPAFTDVVFLSILLAALTYTAALKADAASAIVSAIIFFQRIQSRMQSTLTAWQQIRDESPLLTEYLGPEERAQEIAFQPGTSEITAKHIEFSYPDSLPLFEDLSFTLRKSEWVRVCGANGAGKTTLATILMGLYKCEGDLCFRGIHQRRMISGSPSLLHGDAWTNIDFGRGMSRAKIEARLRQLELWTLISPLLMRQGFSPSAGERQLIGIARALMDDAQLLIFDEATSHLAKEIENLIFQTVERHFPSAIVVVISHREISCPRTIRSLDLHPAESSRLSALDC